MDFSKANFADPSLPANQDCITANACLTRGTNQGLYNIAKEAGYEPTSPADTEWATDLVPGNAGKTIAATNFADLSFTNWVDAYGGMSSRQLPTIITSRNAVLHLITDNIYLDIRFTTWGGSGGAYTYQRAVATPAPTTTGDYNRDGAVDAADYVVWRDTLEQIVSPAGAGADGNANGMIDTADYDFWRARFGNEVPPDGVPGALAASVPEPGSLLLLATALLWCGSARRRGFDKVVNSDCRVVGSLVRHAPCALVFAVLACGATPASAFFHLWRFSEFFSNADGSVQFVELSVSSNGESFSQGAQIRSQSTGKTFTFPRNLSSSLTAGKNLLIATSGFDSLPGGVTPDFTLSSTNFFNPAGDTMTLHAGGVIDSKSFTSLPTDGVMSRVYPSNTLVTNSPRNFAGTSGSVNLAPPAPSPTGDYNGNGEVDAADYTVWRDALTQSVTAGEGADGNANGTIDPADYDFWQARFGNVVPGSSGAASVPEPTARLLALGCLSLLAGCRGSSRQG
jgi:hypothetical protein